MARNARHPYRRRLLRPAQLELPEVEVSEVDGIRSLHLGSETVQSSMDIAQPERLVLSYSRAMMAWLLFNDDPRQIVQIGLGGGSFARWIAHYLPDAHSVAVDINPQVIAVARSLFELPPEDDFFQIVEADGAAYIKILRDSCDVLLVDAFDGYQIIDALTESDFFEDCRNALSANGVFVANWWSGDVRYVEFLERLLDVFAGRVIEVPASSHGNIAVMAFKNAPDECRLDALQRRVTALEAHFHLEFETFLQAIRDNNTHSGGSLPF